MMRGVNLTGLFAFAAALVGSTPAEADILRCLAGCSFFDNPSHVDYTVLADGHFYRWDLIPDNPGITVSLQPPNNTFASERLSDGDGTFQQIFVGFSPFFFSETAAPGLTSITMWAPASFSDCNAASPAGEVCSASYSVFGNAVEISLTGSVPGPRDPPAIIHLSITAIPEPASWALMILGFGLAGSAARVRRSKHLSPLAG